MLDKESGIQKRDCDGDKHLVVISDEDIHQLVIRRYSDPETEWKLPREWVQRDIPSTGPLSKKLRWGEDMKETEKETAQKRKGMISADSLKLKMGIWLIPIWRLLETLKYAVSVECFGPVLDRSGFKREWGKREYRQFFQGILL